MSTTKEKNILIVDDDEDLVNLYETFLKYDGYKVDSFTDPVDALSSFRKDVYDLVLLDLKMPEMNGVELFHELQTIDPNLLYRFITAANKEYNNIKINNIGIEENIIYKPLWLNELRTTIHSLLPIKEKQQKEDKEDKDNKLLMAII
jgi:DNA-binding response OmpR family regulator